MWKVIMAGLVVCWVLLASVGHRMPDRLFLVALGLTVTVSVYVAVRGPAWYEAYRLGRLVDREVQAALNEANGHAPRERGAIGIR